MRDGDVAFWSLAMVMIIGGVVIILAAMLRRQKILEMAHRERMAMIERGLGPAMPNPLGPAAPWEPGPTSASAVRSRLLSGGIAVIGFGAALTVLIGIAAGELAIAIGIGGAVAILGASFVVIALVRARDVPRG